MLTPFTMCADEPCKGSGLHEDVLAYLFPSHFTIQCLLIDCTQHTKAPLWRWSLVGAWLQKYSIQLERLHIINAWMPVIWTPLKALVTPTASTSTIILENFAEAFDAGWTTLATLTAALQYGAVVQDGSMTIRAKTTTAARKLDSEMMLPSTVTTLSCPLNALGVNNLAHIKVSFFRNTWNTVRIDRFPDAVYSTC